MSKIYILLVEDQVEVLDVIVKDLKDFETIFPIVTARSVSEAKQVVSKIIKNKDKIGLFLCDHIMPGENGVDYLVELQNDPITTKSKKVLLTGQAGLEATIKAINEAGLNHYISKPWKKDELLKVVKENLTEYVISNEKDLLKYMALLDGGRLAEVLRTKIAIKD
jgi:two-component system, chemotaxis family, chemotaxis protein CheY